MRLKKLLDITTFDEPFLVELDGIGIMEYKVVDWLSSGISSFLKVKRLYTYDCHICAKCKPVDIDPNEITEIMRDL